VLPGVLEAYEECGYRVDLGGPSRLYATLVDRRTGRSLRCSGGISPSDGLLFAALARAYQPQTVFVIGTSFGLSAFVLAELFPRAVIDVIDAECEGVDNVEGSKITREIARRRYGNVRLTTGYSPQDISKAGRCDKYQFVFIDGLHTNAQMTKD